MSNQIMTDFIIDSKAHCFFCLDKTSPEVQSGRSELNTLHSLQYFSRFIEMDMNTVFLEKGDIPPHLMAKVEMSKLNAHLCERCASLNDTFSSVCRRLEQIKMELLSSLEHIYKEMSDAEGTNQYQKLLNPEEDPGDKWIGKLGILKILRKEAVLKCSIKLQGARPRVKVQNMSKSGISKLMQKYKLHSGVNKTRTRKCTADVINSRMDIPGIKLELDETLLDDTEAYDDPADFESDRESLQPEPSWEEPVILKAEESKSSDSSKRQCPRQRPKRDPKIYKYIERFKALGKLGAQMQYRCRLCKSVSSQCQNMTRHVKIVHLKEKSYKCLECYKVFSLKHILQIHMRLHSGCKAYKCHLCLKDFRQKGHLRRHLLTIHNSRSHNNK